MSDGTEQVADQLHSAQTRYTYFLLAAAASGIALSIQRTSGMAIERSMIPLGLAVICWSVSFFAGCRNRQYFHSTLYANFNLLQVQSGTHPDCLPRTDYIDAASQGIIKAMKRNTTLGNRWSQWQFRFLVLGAVLFVGWHVLEMQKYGNAQESPAPTDRPGQVRASDAGSLRSQLDPFARSTPRNKWCAQQSSGRCSLRMLGFVRNLLLPRLAVNKHG
ncbi:MAG: hypothetical protein AB7T27_10120 [Kiritimatiellia bacterium]